MLSNTLNIKNDHTSAKSNDSHTIPNTQNEQEIFYDALDNEKDDVIPGSQNNKDYTKNFLEDDTNSISDTENDVSNLKEKWKKLDTAKKAGLIGTMVGTLVVLSPLIGVIGTLALPALILGGIAYGVTKGVTSQAVKTTAEKTTEGMKHIGKEVKSKGKNVVDSIKLTKKASNAQKLIQDINSDIAQLATDKEKNQNMINKLGFQREIAEMTQDKSAVQAMQKLVEDKKIPDISSQEIERCSQKGKSTFVKDQTDLKILVNKISAAVESFGTIATFKQEVRQVKNEAVEQVKKDNFPDSKFFVESYKSLDENQISVL